MGGKGGEIVVQAQGTLREDDFRKSLRTQVKLVAPNPHLPQERVQRRVADAFRDEIGQGVQADINRAVAAFIIAVQTAGIQLPFQDAHLAPIVAQAHSRTDSGQAGPDDNHVVHGENEIWTAGWGLDYIRQAGAWTTCDLARS